MEHNSTFVFTSKSDDCDRIFNSPEKVVHMLIHCLEEHRISGILMKPGAVAVNYQVNQMKQENQVSRPHFQTLVFRILCIWKNLLHNYMTRI